MYQVKMNKNGHSALYAKEFLARTNFTTMQHNIAPPEA